MTVATIVVDMQVDFFANARPAAIRSKLAANTNALGAIARKCGPKAIWGYMSPHPWCASRL